MKKKFPKQAPPRSVGPTEVPGAPSISMMVHELGLRGCEVAWKGKTPFKGDNGKGKTGEFWNAFSITPHEKSAWATFRPNSGRYTSSIRRTAEAILQVLNGEVPSGVSADLVIEQGPDHQDLTRAQLLRLVRERWTRDDTAALLNQTVSLLREQHRDLSLRSVGIDPSNAPAAAVPPPQTATGGDEESARNLTDPVTTGVDLESDFYLPTWLEPDQSVSLAISHDPRPQRNRPEYTVPKLFLCSVEPVREAEQPTYRIDLHPVRVTLTDPRVIDGTRVIGEMMLREIWARIETEADLLKVRYSASALARRQYADGSVCANMGGQGAPHFRLANMSRGLDETYSIGRPNGATFQVLPGTWSSGASVTLEVTSRGGFHFSKPPDELERTPGGKRSEADLKAFERAVEAWMAANSNFKSEDFDSADLPKDLIPNTNTNFRLATVFFQADADPTTMDDP